MNYMLAWKGAYGVSDYDGIVSPAYAVYKIDPQYADRRFIHHRLRSEHMRSVFRARSKGIIESRLRLYPDAFLSMELELPDLDAQKAIADFLDRETSRIDQLLEKKQRLVDLLEEKVRRAISQTFEELESEFEKWRLKHLLKSSLAYGANEPANSDDPDDIRYIRITDIDSDGKLRPDTFRSLPRETVSSYLLEDGDILLARSGATVGKSFIYRSAMGECCYAGYLIRARLNKKRIFPEFLRHFTASDQYWNHILGTNIQSTIQNVSAEKYANLQIPLPPLERQRSVTSEVDALVERTFETKDKVARSIERLREFRSALTTAAVTGQIDVTTWGKKGQTDRRLDDIQEAMGA